MTGRGFGPCGGGDGYGRGYGSRRWYPTKKEETEILEEEAKDLENELKAVKERISDLKDRK
jgi:hypothetical protein